jgi:hypothetical protein
VFPLSHCKFPLPRIKGPTTLQYPTARVCFLRVTSLIPFPLDEGPTTHPSCTYITLLYDASPQKIAMASGSGGEYGCGPEFWEEQDPEFKGQFPVLQKRDFRSMCEVRSYAPNKPVLWPTCSHGECSVMQVYKSWGNYGRRFWHFPLARVSYGNDICSSTMLDLLTFIFVFLVLRRWWQLWLLVMGGSLSHWPLSVLHQLPPRHRHLQPEVAPGRITCFPPPTTNAALVRLVLVNATRRWEIGPLLLHLHQHHWDTTCHLSSPQAPAPSSLASSPTTSFRM